MDNNIKKIINSLEKSYNRIYKLKVNRNDQENYLDYEIEMANIEKAIEYITKNESLLENMNDFKEKI